YYRILYPLYHYILYSIYTIFHHTTMSFLGYIISHHGVEMDPTSNGMVKAHDDQGAAKTLTSISIVEVDVSNCGIGAILSQHHVIPAKLYPCAYNSRKFISAEVNYDVGNKELLSIKAALETLITDHKSLEYLKGAKRLNP
ncbi:hypothetical protein QTP86_020375, partial [Hemibagrus guttatus]